MFRLDESTPDYKRLFSEYKSLTQSGKFVGTQPKTMERKDINAIVEKDYHYVMKHDGKRFLIFIDSNGFPFFIDREMVFYFHQVDLKKTILKNSIFDCEIMDKKCFIFDALFINGKDKRTPNHSVRMEFDLFKIDGLTVTKNEIFSKGFLAINLNKVEKALKEHEWKGHEIDGLIFYGNENNYQNTPMFKFKLSKDQTIDFKIKYIGQHVELYKNQPMLRVGLQVRNRDKIVGYKINNQFAVGLIPQKRLHFICEFSWDSQRRAFIFERERPLKTSPNALLTANSVWKTIQNPVFLNDLVKPTFIKLLKRKTREELLECIKFKIIN